MIWLLLACADSATPTTVAECQGADPCLVQVAVSQMASNPDVGIAALNAITDPEARLAAGGMLFSDRSAVFDFGTSRKICTALRQSFDESFCQRRLGQGHLRTP